MPLLKLMLRGGSVGCLIILVVLALSALFWGWIFMVIAGACGWHIPYLPTGVAIGFGLSLFLG